MPLLEDPGLAWDHPTLSTYGYGNHAVVSDRYRYIRYVDGSEELYDHSVDPHEWTNLAGKRKFADVIETLSQYLPADNAPDLAARN